MLLGTMMMGGYVCCCLTPCLSLDFRMQTFFNNLFLCWDGNGLAFRVAVGEEGPHRGPVFRPVSPCHVVTVS